VQSLDRPGVAARSVAECLLLQLSLITDPHLRECARAIVGDHLDSLAARDVAHLARVLGEAPAVVERACECIRRLDPHPGWRFDDTRIHYITPDVVVRKRRGCLLCDSEGTLLDGIALIVESPGLRERLGASARMR